MAPTEAKKMAENYLKAQAKIIAKYGSPPKLSGDRYRRAMNDTRRTFQTLTAAGTKGK
jgi:hypothetical protein